MRVTVNCRQSCYLGRISKTETCTELSCPYNRYGNRYDCWDTEEHNNNKLQIETFLIRRFNETK